MIFLTSLYRLYIVYYMRKERVNNLKNTKSTNNSKVADLKLRLSTSDGFSRDLRYSLNLSTNGDKELPPAPPNSCVLPPSAGIAAAIDVALVTKTNDECNAGSRYSNKNLTDDGSTQIMSGIIIQGAPATEITIELTNPDDTTYDNVFLSGPGLSRTDLKENNTITHTISSDGLDLLLLELPRNNLIRGDIDGDGIVVVKDIMDIVYHIMRQENDQGKMEGELSDDPINGFSPKDRAIYVNESLPSVINGNQSKQEININTLMEVVFIAMAQN